MTTTEWDNLPWFHFVLLNCILLHWLLFLLASCMRGCQICSSQSRQPVGCTGHLHNWVTTPYATDVESTLRSFVQPLRSCRNEEGTHKKKATKEKLYGFPIIEYPCTCVHMHPPDIPKMSHYKNLSLLWSWWTQALLPFYCCLSVRGIHVKLHGSDEFTNCGLTTQNKPVIKHCFTLIVIDTAILLTVLLVTIRRETFIKIDKLWNAALTVWSLSRYSSPLLKSTNDQFHITSACFSKISLQQVKKYSNIVVSRRTEMEGN